MAARVETMKSAAEVIEDQIKLLESLRDNGVVQDQELLDQQAAMERVIDLLKHQ